MTDRPPPRLDKKKRQNVKDAAPTDKDKATPSPKTAPAKHHMPRWPHHKGKITHKDHMTFMAHKRASTVLSSWYAHLTLLIAIVLYTAIGALLFAHIEGGPEYDAVNEIITERNIIIDRIQKMVSSGSKQISSQIDRLLKTYEVVVAKKFKEHSKLLSKGDDDINWSFIDSLFFCTTVYTTIGYGHITPITIGGKLLTIIYALVGIPLFMIILSDFGKILTRSIKYLWTRICHSKTIRKNRVWPKRRSDITTVEEIFSTTGKAAHVPVSLALAVLMFYIFAGAALFYGLENWNYFESFYFVFVSFMTIGFGDYTPTNGLNKMLFIFYLIFGLALTFMFLHVVGLKIMDKTSKAIGKIKIGLSIAEHAVERELHIGHNK